VRERVRLDTADGFLLGKPTNFVGPGLRVFTTFVVTRVDFFADLALAARFISPRVLLRSTMWVRVCLIGGGLAGV
jgi:hypothetical protein